MSLRLAGVSSSRERRHFFAWRPRNAYSRDSSDAERSVATELEARRCQPCEGGVEPLRPDQAEALLAALDEEWSLTSDGLGIERTFHFSAYSRSLGFANAVAWIAIVEGHHPVLTVRYGSCSIRYTTHAINGLSDSDFICAAKIDRLAAQHA